MSSLGRARPSLLAAIALIAAACGKPGASTSADGGVLDGGSAGVDGGDSAPSLPQQVIAQPAGKPMLGVVAFVTTVYKEPRDTSKKLGYLRVGSKVARSEEPVGRAGCPGGWYAIHPRGYVCAGDEATTELDHPILRAVPKGPNLKTALPFRYAFVRAVLPLYLRVPSSEEQYKAEFKLKEHLDWYKDHEGEVTKVLLGGNDVPIDDRGVPIPGKKLGELGMAKNSTELPVGVLLGGEGDNDPLPFWLEGNKRHIPNISDYKTKGFEIFADRARRHTGLSLIGSFVAGPESLSRRFAITADLRLAPATKIKPDTGSPWHGVELDGSLTLPLAFVRSQSARAFKIAKGKVVPGEALEHRSAIGLTGTQRTIEGVKYYRTTDKRWLSQEDVGLAVAPATFPEDAEKGKKWVEISITNQTLVLWEGKKPVYVTLVSTGQAGLDNPKKTTATPRGTFKIRNKHISAMMDSNESSAVGGKADTSVRSASTAGSSGGDDDDKPAPKGKSAGKGKGLKGDKAAKGGKGDKGGKGSEKAKTGGGDKPPPGYVPKKGDGLYGVTRRRGEGTFQLKDVPYIQFFESGYALHTAYWHDVFGTPRSHGCVNLSPVDAHRIFFWTDPPVPEGWHGLNTGEDMGEGTTVIIHE